MRILAFVFFIALYSCANSSSDTGNTTDTASVDSTAAAEEPIEQSPAAPIPGSLQPFEKTLSGDEVQFTIFSPNKMQGNTLMVAPKGLQHRNDTLSFDIQGMATEAQMADLNQDGFPEVYIFVKNVGEQPSSTIYGFASYRNRSYGAINVRDIPRGEGMMEGYQGDDEFTLEKTALKRSFPVYKDMGTEAESMAGKRTITYQLKKGEASFILEPTGSEIKE